MTISSFGNSNTAQSNTKRNDQQVKKVMSVKQLILLVSMTGFVSTPVWRVCTLISRFKGFTLAVTVTTYTCTARHLGKTKENPDAIRI